MEGKVSINRQALILDQYASEDEFADYLVQVKKSKDLSKIKRELTSLLSERHPIYHGRSTKTVSKMRGFITSSFESVGLPNRALPYVLEALESSFDPYLVAAASKALRGMSEPIPNTGPFLIKSIYNIWQMDLPVHFETYYVQWPLKKFKTALDEVFDTLDWMGTKAQKVLPDLTYLYSEFKNEFNEKHRNRLVQIIEQLNEGEDTSQDCCDISLKDLEQDKKLNIPSFDNVMLEDQDGEPTKWKEFFQGSHTILAFFYTRCTNPRKCTLTIQNLIKTQKILQEKGLTGHVNIAAITYDPDFDTAAALKSYGRARNFTFNEKNKIFRTTYGFEELVRAFGLGVNYTGSLVNHHRIELFVLDNHAKLLASFLRFEIDPDKIIHLLEETLDKGVKLTSSSNRGLFKVGLFPKFNNVFSFILPILSAFFPKCPICWASYMSLFGLTTLGSIPYTPWLYPVITGLLLINLIVLFIRARRRDWYTSFSLSCIGTVIILMQEYFEIVDWLVYPGILLLFIGSLLGSLNISWINKFKVRLLDLRFKMNSIN